MIRVGITFNPNKPLFYSGLNQTAVQIAELLQTLQYEMTLIDYTNDDATWFTDYPQTYQVEKLHQVSNLDLLVDVDGHVSEAARHKAAKKTVVFLRTFLQFAEMDAQLYIESPYVPRSMKGVTEIWCWDILNPLETIPSIQTLFPCPIKRVPFIWTPTIVKHYAKPITYTQGTSWMVHVAEKNADNSSSSILPIVALRELSGCEYKIHNMEHLKENRFLKENVLANIEFEKLPVAFAEKEPWYEWTENSILLAHSRFIPLRIGLLNAIWLGIPLIHNSPILLNLHPTLKKMYYEGNSIQGIQRALQQLLSDPDNIWFNEVLALRTRLEEVFSIAAKRTEWQTIIENTFCIMVQPQIVLDDVTPLVIAFDDMWPGFNYDVNFIMDALRHEQPERSIKGVNYTDGLKANLLIFGPYSEGWKRVTTIPKVYFSGENWQHPTDPSVSLFISSAAIEDGTHMRVPTWMHFIDWYTDSTTLPENLNDNPIRMPLHFAVTQHPTSFEKRERFCGFVVSNPVCQIRNEAFQHLNTYKPVSSGGAYQNNIGGQLQLKYPGGGCGDISKHHFFAEHKFTISFENSQSPGYITEKLLHAKMAGCVPLYWGDPTLVGSTVDFVPNSFVNLSNMADATKIVDIMKKLETNPAMCEKIAATPLLDETKKQMALQTISAMSRRLLLLATQTSVPIPQQHTVIAIDKTYMINLDSRPDRLESFVKVHPDITFTRSPAVYGKTLQMSGTIYKLCKHNTFQWKKSVIGCALSHISVWNKIVQGDATYTLIIEDDVRFNPGWFNYVKDIPDDAELVYLGGVLPANRQVLPHALEKVNECWSRIKPNQFFSKDPLPLFHFCAYSYLLTKRGAQKLLDYLEHSVDKLCIPVDHLIGHPVIGLTKYVANNLLTFCFQEEDQQYNNAAFNDLQTEKKFDSDIYNHTECFDVSTYENPKTDYVVLYYLSKDAPVLYEQIWLQDIFCRPIQYVKYKGTLQENAWCLLQRPHIQEWNTILSTQTMPFQILHLSDEFGTDDITCYNSPMCKKVVRNYLRPMTENKKVTVIPLGYHHKSDTVKPIQDRKLVWSFHGTDWFNRGTLLKQFVEYTPHHCRLQPQWNDPGQTKQDAYLVDLGNSKFCPVLRGNHEETFRLYESLEAGTLPIAVEANEYTRWIDENLRLSELYDWTNPKTMGLPIGEEVQKEVVKRWEQWKEKVMDIMK